MAPIEENLKKEILDAIAESGRYFGALLEEVRDDVRIAIESISCLDITVQKNHQEFREFRAEANEKFDMLFGEVQRFDGVETRLDGVEGRLDILDGGMRQLLSDNQEFFTELRRNRADISNLDGRVAVLEEGC